METPCWQLLRKSGKEMEIFSTNLLLKLTTKRFTAFTNFKVSDERQGTAKLTLLYRRMASQLLRIVLVLVAVLVVASATTRVTCIGDSITSGGGCGVESYTGALQVLLGSDYAVTNAGCSAMTMLKKGECNGGGYCSYWSTNEWQAALNSKPDIVTIMLGTNDAKTFNWEGVQQSYGDYFALDYVDMINKMKNLGDPEIYVLIPPPLYEPYPYEMNKTIINQIYPNLIRDIASVTGVQVIDVFSAFVGWDVDSTEKTCDGCHPTDDGAFLIADTIAATLKEKSKHAWSSSRGSKRIGTLRKHN
jgi:acyl-CoA thioesterase-1